MGVIDGRTWLEHISPTSCWSLLASTPVGRIGVINDSAPEIYPVNHVVDRDTIVFRTDPGSKLRGLLRSPAVCYQVDGIDPADATGWSVLLKGRARTARPRRPAPCGDPAAALLDAWRQGALDPHHPGSGHRPAHLESHHAGCLAGNRRRGREPGR